MSENYLYYVLIEKDNGAKLSACIDVDTVDDDEPEVEYLDDNGVWGRTTSPEVFTTADGEELSCAAVNNCEVENWDFISQALVDNENIVDDAKVYEFDEAYLVISDDDEITYSSCVAENYIEEATQKIVSFVLSFHDEELEGCMELVDALDEDALQFLDHNGFDNGRNLPKNPYDMDKSHDQWVDYQWLITTIGSTDIIGILVKYSDAENKEIVLDEIDGEKLTLTINQDN